MKLCLLRQPQKGLWDRRSEFPPPDGHKNSPFPGQLSFPDLGWLRSEPISERRWLWPKSRKLNVFGTLKGKSRAVCFFQRMEMWMHGVRRIITGARWYYQVVCQVFSQTLHANLKWGILQAEQPLAELRSLLGSDGWRICQRRCLVIGILKLVLMPDQVCYDMRLSPIGHYFEEECMADHFGHDSS